MDFVEGIFFSVRARVQYPVMFTWMSQIVGFDGFLTHLTVGQRVAFEVTANDKGRCATHLRAIGCDALEHKNPASPQKGFVVMHGYKYVRPEGETTGANDLLVPMFVHELAGRAARLMPAKTFKLNNTEKVIARILCKF